MAFTLEFLFKFLKILDDPVVNDQDLPRTIRVRMRVDFIGYAVGGPAGGEMPMELAGMGCDSRRA